MPVSRSTRTCWPISTACPISSSSPLAMSRPRKAATFSGNRAPRGTFRETAEHIANYQSRPDGGFVAGSRAMAREDSEQAPTALGERLFATRKLTLDLAAPLSDADSTVQPFPDASPAKWHLAHTTWFFETFILRDHVAGYALFDERWPFLFNSYYDGEGERHARPRRGMLSRPSLDEVRAYRAHVDEALERSLESLPPAALKLIELGTHHEQQHQELFLTDILATLAENPLEPAYGELPQPVCFADEPLTWHAGRAGVVEIGATDEGFAFDSERPRHHTFLCPH